MLDKNTKLKVHEYKVLGELPDLFTLNNGSKVKTKEDWEARRKEMYETAVVLQYGDLPEPEFLDVETLYEGKHSSYRIITGRKTHPVSFVMTYVSTSSKKSPVIVDGDLCFPYAFNKEFLSAATNNGVAWAFFNRTELAHDVMHEGYKGQLYEAYPEYTFGALRAWAWGYSRCVDALIKLGLVDEDYIAFSGHSRGGKTAMLAGVLDQRASIVNPNATCAGSSSCYRVHIKAEDDDGKVGRSETLDDLIHNFDFWVTPELAKYRNDEANLPFDCHFLKALVAPRTLFLSEAVHDIWSNPIGSWQTTMASKEAYKFLGAEENLFWYFRDGKHYHDIKDLNMLVNLINHKKNGEALDEDFFRRPFDEYPPIYKKFDE